MIYTRAKNWALLSCGPSLYDSWTNDHYELYDFVVTINQAGKHFWHDVCYHLDTPSKVFGKDGGDHWKTTLGKTVTGKVENRNWGYTFPHALAWCMKNSPRDARIHLYGWDCSGIKPVENAPWIEKRTEIEEDFAVQITEFWPGKLTQVFGGMREWAIETNLIERPPA